MKKWLLCLVTVILIFSILLTADNISKHKAIYQQDFILTGEGCLILNYHRIRTSGPLIKLIDRWIIFFTKDPELMLYSIYEDEFKKQIAYLIDRGYHFITPDELKGYLYNSIDIPKKSVLITFDDVDVSVYDNAFQFLLEKQIPFTLFIITGDVGNLDFKGLELTSWNQIREMKNSGLATIGIHTHQMHELDKQNNPPFFYDENLEDFIKDTKLAIESIEVNLGVNSIYYAYAYGFGTPKTDEILLDLGCELIFTLRPGIVERGDPSYFIKRVLVSKYSWSNVVEWVKMSD
ncbi:MAG: polysaccharide deacetylase family protein [Vulcanibacillus sp.]